MFKIGDIAKVSIPRDALKMSRGMNLYGKLYTVYKVRKCSDRTPSFLKACEVIIISPKKSCGCRQVVTVKPSKTLKKIAETSGDANIKTYTCTVPEEFLKSTGRREVNIKKILSTLKNRSKISIGNIINQQGKTRIGFSHFHVTDSPKKFLKEIRKPPLINYENSEKGLVQSIVSLRHRILYTNNCFHLVSVGSVECLHCGYIKEIDDAKLVFTNGYCVDCGAEGIQCLTSGTSWAIYLGKDS